MVYSIHRQGTVMKDIHRQVGCRNNTDKLNQIVLVAHDLHKKKLMRDPIIKSRISLLVHTNDHRQTVVN